MTHCCLMASGSLSFGTALGWCDPFMKSCPIVRIDSLRLTTRCRWVSFRWMPGGEWMIHDTRSQTMCMKHVMLDSTTRSQAQSPDTVETDGEPPFIGVPVHPAVDAYSLSIGSCVPPHKCSLHLKHIKAASRIFFFLFKEKRQLKGTRKKKSKTHYSAEWCCSRKLC